jgi:hypothetical protein
MPGRLGFVIDVANRSAPRKAPTGGGRNAIVAALLSGDKVPFIGTVSGNIVKFVSDMGSAGLVGLISLGFIVWLFSNRKLS